MNQTPFVVEHNGAVRDRATGVRVGYVYADKPRHWHYIPARGQGIALTEFEMNTNGYAHAKRDAADTLYRAWRRSLADWRHCGRGPCSARDGHEGECER